MNRIDELLRYTVEHGASDLHISSNHCHCLRIDGEVQFLSERPVISPAIAEVMMKEIMPDKSKEEIDNIWDTDFGYTLQGFGRFRVNAFRDIHGVGGVFRVVPDNVPALEDLGLGFVNVLRELCMHTKGLIIVTGPTGSGKSTTLAAMIDYINRTRTDHVINIEDPIEFVHPSKGCIINQREVYRHTPSF